MLTFSCQTLIHAPVQTLWSFHERSDVLQLLTPPWQPVRVIRREGGLAVGAITEFQIQILFVPVRWVARHVDCEPPYFFCDRQIEGPMTSWFHRHEFMADREGTYLIDTIEYEIPGGWLGELLLGGWVNARLRDMFRYRHQITQAMCEDIACSLDAYYSENLWCEEEDIEP
jgi:ligand-binding SRPBCC domain-containing protein